MYSFYCRMYYSSFLVFFKAYFFTGQEPEPAKKNPEPVKNGPAPQHWLQGNGHCSLGYRYPMSSEEPVITKIIYIIFKNPKQN